MSQTITNKANIRISKTLAWVLRHNAINLGMTMDSEGYVELEQMLKLEQFKGVTKETINQIVESNNKQRYQIKLVDDKTMIRANQGHSKSYQTVLDDSEMLTLLTEPLDNCIHGTTLEAYQKIKESGLNVMGRVHIHFAIGNPSDPKVISGIRSSSNVLIYIDMKKAMDSGIQFYISSNNVILSKGHNGTIQTKYFKNILIK